MQLLESERDLFLNYTLGYDLLQKIVVFEEFSATKFLLLLEVLDPAPPVLCNDQVTHVQLTKHFGAFHPPRLVLLF